MPSPIEMVRTLEGVDGIAITIAEKMAVWGKIKLVKMVAEQ